MKKIRISGDIGFDYSTQSITDDLKGAAGDDIEIDIASPGGSVFDGLDIYNQIRDYKRDYPKSKITVAIKGLAASMASYIASVDVADKVIAEDNAVYMIHNPWSVAIGDYKEMKKNSDFLEGLSRILALAYKKKTGKSEKEITAMMDAETWLYGDEIKEAGFVDEIIQSPDNNTKDKVSAITTAKMAFSKMQKNMKELENENDIEKAVALVRVLSTNGSIEEKKTGVAGKNKYTPEGGRRSKAMDLKELQAEYPEVYAEAINAGVKKEQERVKALMAMRAKPEYQKLQTVLDCIDKAIAEGVSKEEATASVLAVLTNGNILAEQESPEGIVIKGGASVSGEVVKPVAEWKPGEVEEV